MMHSYSRKSILFLCLLSMGIAQNMQRGGAMQPPPPVNWEKELDLSKEQAKQMQIIQDNFRSELMDIRNSGGNNRMAMREMAMELMEKRDSAVKGVLSKKQFKKYQKKLKSQRDTRMRQGAGRDRGGRRGNSGRPN
ncbi:MAG: hypothetical protein OXU46_02580 [Candidatus Marinimicrobia bacterium]|nr:hypothetical protein [Candidatus Neomarinimicrobiota bacterium]